MANEALRSGAYLHHLMFSSPKPERLAGFYADAMGMEAEKAGDAAWVCRGPRRLLVVTEGPAKRLQLAGFACRDAEGLTDLRDLVGAAGMDVVASTSPLFAGLAFAVVDPNGHRIAFGLNSETGAPRGPHAPLQHLTFVTDAIDATEAFYADKLGFAISDRVVHTDGRLMASFLRSNHEHHTIACFRGRRRGVDHHSYEAGEWSRIRDWADRFAERRIQLVWGPGRHGPGNNLFIFIEDPDGNWIEVSAELEVVNDRATVVWPHESRTLNLWGDAVMRS